MVRLDGVDYSHGYPGSAALNEAGQVFVCRYLAEDARGLTPEELADLTAGGIEVVVIYESVADRMLDGYAAGQSDAHYAQGLLVGLGLPAAMPIYFTADFDATPGQQAAIDAYLDGATSVIGLARVGVYGGYYVIERCVANQTAAWFWQTSAWSGGQVSVRNHLYQYAYDLEINGVACDRDLATQVNYGQASLVGVTPPKHATRHPIPLPWQTKEIGGHLFVKHGAIVTAAEEVPVLEYADPHARPVGKPLPKGKRVRVAYICAGSDGEMYYVSRGGARMFAKGFTE